MSASAQVAQLLRQEPGLKLQVSFADRSMGQRWSPPGRWQLGTAAAFLRVALPGSQEPSLAVAEELGLVPYACTWSIH